MVITRLSSSFVPWRYMGTIATYLKHIILISYTYILAGAIWIFSILPFSMVRPKKSVQIAWGFTKRQGVHAEFASARITAEKHAKSRWPDADDFVESIISTILHLLSQTCWQSFWECLLSRHVKTTPMYCWNALLARPFVFLKGEANWSVARNIGFTCGLSVLLAVLSKCSI